MLMRRLSAGAFYDNTKGKKINRRFTLQQENADAKMIQYVLNDMRTNTNNI